MHSLPVFLRLQGRPVILIGDGEAAQAKARLLTRAGALIVDEAADAALAIVAVEDDSEARAAIARLRARGILINAVDRSAACDFTLPAIVDRDPVIVAIGTGGASAGLAKALRARIETMLPPRLGSLATLLNRVRAALRMRWPQARDRRLAIDAALSPGGPLDPLMFDDDNAVTAWLNDPEIVPQQMHMIVLTSPDPDDLTLRAARLLGQADTVFHTGDIPPAILWRARADAARVVSAAPPAAPPPGVSVFISFG